MAVTLGQQYNVGEKPTVILFTYINRHAGIPSKTTTLGTMSLGHKLQRKNLLWHLIGFPDGSNIVVATPVLWFTWYVPISLIPNLVSIGSVSGASR